MARATPALLLLAVLAGGCNTEPLAPIVPGAREVVPPQEYQRRLERIEDLIARGRTDEALAQVRSNLAEWPPDPYRQRLRSLLYELGEARFYREHPLHLSLAMERERYAFGEPVHVTLRITNLGPERLELPAAHRSWGDALLLREAERSVLLLHSETEDLDGSGGIWGGHRVHEVELDRDFVLAPGGSAVIRTEVPQAEQGAALVRRLKVWALYRPIVILSEDGERRFDPFEFPAAACDVFAATREQSQDGGLVLLRDCLAHPVPGRESALFLAAMGLSDAELHAGIDLLARTAPSLDPARRRAALAALRAHTGIEAAGDPVRVLDWWELTGRSLSVDDLRRRSGRRSAAAGTAWKAGTLDLDRSAPPAS